MAIVPDNTTLANLSNIVLGYTTTNARDIFNKSKINKWAKNKPVDRNFTGKITDDSRKAGKWELGIYWGLQAGTATGNWANIHNATWEYVDFPTGGINSSPYRVWDFVGYDTAAKPTLTGYSSEGASGKASYNAGTPFGLLLTWARTNNTTGVDIFQCTNLTGVNLQNYYLFIMVDDWCRAMINNDAGNAVNPIYHNGVECRTFSCPKLPTELQNNATRKVSFFLADINDVNLDVRNNWVNTWGLQMGVQPISIPEAVNYSVTLSSSGISYDFMTATISLSYESMRNTIDAFINITQHAPTEQNYGVYLTLAGQPSTVKRFTGGTSMSLVPLLYWTSSDTGIMWMPGQTMSYTVELYGLDSSNNPVQLIDSESGSITIPNE